MLGARLAVKGRLGRLKLMGVVPFQYCCILVAVYVQVVLVCLGLY